MNSAIAIEAAQSKGGGGVIHQDVSNPKIHHQDVGGSEDSNAALGGLLFFSQRMRLKPIVTMTAGQRNSRDGGSSSRFRNSGSGQSDEDAKTGRVGLHNNHLHPISRPHHHHVDVTTTVVGNAAGPSPTSTSHQRTMYPPSHYTEEDNSTYTNSTQIANPSSTSESPLRSSTNAMIVKNGRGGGDVGNDDVSSTTTTAASGNMVAGLASTASWPSVQMQRAPMQDTNVVTTLATEGGCILYSRGIAATTTGTRHHFSPPAAAVSRKTISTTLPHHHNNQQHQHQHRGHHQQQSSGDTASSTSYKPIPTFESVDTAFASSSTTNSKSTNSANSKQRRTPDALSPGSGFSMCSQTPYMEHRTSETSSVANSNPRTFEFSSSKLISGSEKKFVGSRFSGSSGSGKKSSGTNNNTPNKKSRIGGVAIAGMMKVACDTSTPLSSSVYRGAESATPSSFKYGRQQHQQHQQQGSFSQDSCGWERRKSADHEDLPQHQNLLPPTHKSAASTTPPI